MKTKKITLTFFVVFQIFYYSSFVAQTSIFRMANDTTVGTMSAKQVANYRILLHNDMYNSIKVIETERLAQVIDSSRIFISLPFFEDTSLTFMAQSFDYKNDSNFVWVGVYTNDSAAKISHGAITIMRDSGIYIGHLNLDDSSYELFDLTDGIQVFCKSKLAGDGLCGEPNITNNNDTIVGSKPGDNPCGNITTRVLVLYTSEATQVNPNITGSAALAVSQLNTIWSNSGIYNTVILAGVRQLSFTQNLANPSGDAALLASNSTAQALRVSYKADMVILLARDSYSGGINGVVNAVDALPSQAYAISQVNHATDGRFTFTHELQHLYGARHSVDLDNSPVNAHGLIFNTECTGFFNQFCNTRRTIMASLPSGLSRIEHTSNPSVNFHNKPTGASNRNNANQIIDKLVYIANFVPDAIPKHGWMTAKKSNCSVPARFNVVVCDDPESFTYSWYKSYNGINWFSVGANSSTYFQNGKAFYFIKCIVNMGNNRFYNFQLFVHGCVFNDFTTALPIENLTGTTAINQQGRSNIATSIEPEISGQNDMFSVYPNPSSGDFNVQFLNQSSKKGKVIIFDYTGKQIEVIETIELKIGLNDFKILPKNKLSKGVYFIRIIGTEKSLLKLLVIE